MSPRQLTDDDFRSVDFGGFADAERPQGDEFAEWNQRVPGRTREEAEQERRAARIASSAGKAPIILARQVVERHIRDLRARQFITLPPNTPGLVIALEQLTHDVASAILDARLAPKP